MCDCIPGGFCSPDCPERMGGRKPVKVCSKCGSTIYEGEAYYPVGFVRTKPICRECCEEMNGLEMLELIGEKMEIE